MKLPRTMVLFWPRWRWLCSLGIHDYMALLIGWHGDDDEAEAEFDDWECEICGKRKPYVRGFKSKSE